MKHEIKCPSCGKAFTIDEASYAEIQNQVRNSEFNKEVEARLHSMQEANEQAVKNAKLSVKSEYERQLSTKEQEVTKLKSQLDSDVNKLRAKLTEEFAEEKIKEVFG